MKYSFAIPRRKLTPEMQLVLILVALLERSLEFPSLFSHFDNSKTDFNKHNISDDVTA